MAPLPLQNQSSQFLGVPSWIIIGMTVSKGLCNAVERDSPLLLVLSIGEVPVSTGDVAESATTPTAVATSWVSIWAVEGCSLAGTEAAGLSVTTSWLQTSTKEG